MRLKRLLSGFWVLVGFHVSLLNAQEMFPVGNFEKLRRGNCTNCHDRIPVNGAHLPRLTLIKQRILQALGRGGENEPQGKHIAPTFLPKAFIAPKQTTARPPEEENDPFGINEIVTFSETIGRLWKQRGNFLMIL